MPAWSIIFLRSNERFRERRINGWVEAERKGFSQPFFSLLSHVHSTGLPFGRRVALVSSRKKLRVFRQRPTRVKVTLPLLALQSLQRHSIRSWAKSIGELTIRSLACLLSLCCLYPSSQPACLPVCLPGDVCSWPHASITGTNVLRSGTARRSRVNDTCDCLLTGPIVYRRPLTDRQKNRPGSR